MLLPILLYAGALRFGYVLDDKLVLSENKFVQKGAAGIPEIFTHDAFTGFLGKQQDLVAGSRYRPLSIATFAIEQQLFGVSPGISHLLNILLYGLTALLIYRLLHLLAPPAEGRAWYTGLPFVVAALWVLHPLHSEVVANIKGRDEVLALLLALSSAYSLIRGHREGKPWLQWTAGALLLLAILAKENAIAFLVVLPLILLGFDKPDLRTYGKLALPMIVATVVYVALRWSALGFLLNSGTPVTNLMNNPWLQASPSQHSATIGLTLAWYLKLLVLPYPLTHDYYPYHVPLVEWSDWRAILGLVSHLGLLAVAVLGWKRARLLSLGIAFYLVTLFPVSNIPFQVGTFMNERFVYMPSLGFCLALGWLLCVRLPEWLAGRVTTYRGIVMGFLGVTAVACGAVTLGRVPDWENTLTLNASSIRVSGDSAYSNQYYGFALYQQADQTQDPLQKQKLLDQALPYVNRALEIYPDYPDALGTKTGIMVGYFQLNNKIDPLLKWFEFVQKTHPLAYIDTVLRDLIAFGQHRIELNYWLQEVGYNHFWVAKGDQAKATEYIQMLKSIDPENPNVDRALQNIAQGIR